MGELNQMAQDVFNNMQVVQFFEGSESAEKALRLRFPKFSKRLNMADMNAFIEQHIGKDSVIALGQLSFPNEWQLILASNDVRERLLRLQKIKICMRTCWISPFSQTEVRGNIHWLPFKVSDSEVKSKLSDFGRVVFVERQNATEIHVHIMSEVRYFCFYMTPGKTLDDVPYFIDFDEHKSYINIPGRLPVCFHCKERGHLKNACNKYHERLDSQCHKPPSLCLWRRKRGRRFNKNAQETEQSVNAGIAESLNFGKDDYCVPRLVDNEMTAGDLPSTGGLPNPIPQLRELGLQISRALSETVKVLNDSIDTAATLLYSELKSKTNESRPN